VNDGREAVLSESVGRCHETDVITLRRGLFYETDVTARRFESWGQKRDKVQFTSFQNYSR